MTAAPTAIATTASRPRARVWARVLLLIAVLVAPLVAAELVVRALIATDRLPPAQSHFRPLNLMWLNLERFGRPDVLLLGDSITHSGIDPAVLGNLASGELGREIRVFGLAVPGTGPDTSLLLLQELAREGRLPKVAVLGISPPELRGHAAGDAAFRASPMGQQFSRCADVTGYAEVVDCWAGQVSALWRWRGRPDQIANALRRTRWTLGGEGRRHVRTDGFSEGHPASVAKIEHQVAEGLSHEASTINLGSDVAPQYRELVDFLRANGTTVVAALIPYSPPYAHALEAHHPGFDQERLDAARRLSDAIGVDTIDPGTFDAWWGDGSSQNIKHLSRDGAVQFTRQLWDTRPFRDALMDGLDPST